MDAIHYSSESNEWETPQDFFNKLNEEFDFNLDPCSTHENHKTERYFTKVDDGLSKSWADSRVFINPPYGKELKLWVKKAYEESLLGATCVMLIPARTDTSYWHDYIFDKAEIRFLRGRLKFSNSKNSAPFPSAVVVFK